MAETKKPELSTKTDRPTTVQEVFNTPKDTWLYVTVPDEDATGKKYPSITLNKVEFRAGETYHLPRPVAAFITERIKAFNKSVVRLFSNQVDRTALQEVAVGSASPMTPEGDRPGYIDAAQIKTL